MVFPEIVGRQFYLIITNVNIKILIIIIIIIISLSLPLSLTKRLFVDFPTCGQYSAISNFSLSISIYLYIYLYLSHVNFTHIHKPHRPIPQSHECPATAACVQFFWDAQWQECPTNCGLEVSEQQLMVCLLFQAQNTHTHTHTRARTHKHTQTHTNTHKRIPLLMISQHIKLPKNTELYQILAGHIK